MPISGSIHPSFQFHRKPKNPKNPLTKIDISSDHHPQDQNPGFGDIMRTQQSQKVINGDQKGSVKYKECRKNHAASIGGYAVDGCREFMASGEEGTSAAFKCAACNCHRNFHKKEVEDEYCLCDCSSTSSRSSSRK